MQYIQLSTGAHLEYIDPESIKNKERKMGKSHFTKEKNQMSNKYIKKGSTSVEVKNVQICRDCFIRLYWSETEDMPGSEISTHW